MFLTLSRVLFSYSEKFYNLSREADTFAHLYRYLSSEKKMKKKIFIVDLKPYFDEFSEALYEDLLAIDNIYFDCIGATVLNHVNTLK